MKTESPRPRIKELVFINESKGTVRGLYGSKRKVTVSEIKLTGFTGRDTLSIDKFSGRWASPWPALSNTLIITQDFSGFERDAGILIIDAKNDSWLLMLQPGYNRKDIKLVLEMH